jgi:pimeloyl-ACP methyl ester carboxylesterase
MWERQAALLDAHGYEVVAPDLPGFGNEPLPAESFSYVELIAGFLPAVLVGNSFGSRVALETALAPSRRGAEARARRSDAKHLPSLEAPEVFDRSLLDFLGATA